MPYFLEGAQDMLGEAFLPSSTVPELHLDPRLAQLEVGPVKQVIWTLLEACLEKAMEKEIPASRLDVGERGHETIKPGILLVGEVEVGEGCVDETRAWLDSPQDGCYPCGRELHRGRGKQGAR